MQVLATQATPASTPTIDRLREPGFASLAIQRIERDFKAIDPIRQKMKTAAIRFAHRMCSVDAPAHWLSLIGPSGTGKTMLARLLAGVFEQLDYLSDENKNTRAGDRFLRRGGFKGWPRVVQEMLDGDFIGLRDLQDDWFVALDDIGAEHIRNRELSLSKLYETLNARRGKFTVITSNLGLEGLSALDDRIASRLIRDGNIVVDSTGAKDYALST